MYNVVPGESWTKRVRHQHRWRRSLGHPKLGSDRLERRDRSLDGPQLAIRASRATAIIRPELLFGPPQAASLLSNVTYLQGERQQNALQGQWITYAGQFIGLDQAP